MVLRRSARRADGTTRRHHGRGSVPARNPRLRIAALPGALPCVALHGHRILDAAASPVLADALERGTGRIECEVLTQRYLHLSALVGTA